MIRILIVVAGLIASANATAAKTVTVRSGEHNGFTRLVLKVPVGTNWTMSLLEKGAQLTLDLEKVVFETSSVFSRLSKNRLKAIEQVGPGAPLEMKFDCDCAATAFLFRDTMIVVDIAAKKGLPQANGEVPALEPQYRTNERRVGPTEPSAGFAEPLLRLSQQGVHDQLMSRIVQGSDRSILDLNLAPAGPRASDTAALPRKPLDLPAHIEVSSILDELETLDQMPIQTLKTLPDCISNSELGFETWSDGRPFLQQLADFRASLYQEFDRIEPDTALSLAKLLAFFGFGAEAQQVLKLSDIVSPQAEWTRTVAVIVDVQTLPEPHPFDTMQRCDGDIALWAILADGRLMPEADLNGVEQSFLRLPDHLRSLLGPRLADIFVGAQKLEAARRVLRGVDRADPVNRPDATLAKAAVATAEGDIAQSEVLLTEVIHDPSAQTEAPLALARLIEKRWVQDGTITKKQLDLVAAYALELRDSEMGPVLARSHTVAQSLRNQFDPAFDQLRKHDKDGAWAGTQDRVLLMLAERADDITFLRHAMNLTPSQAASSTTKTALSLANRFAELGFAAQVRSMTDLGQDKTRKRERARLRARAALLDGQPRLALSELDKDETELGQRVLAQALTDAGNYSAAIDVWRGIGEYDRAARLSWLAGLPVERASASESNFREILKLSQELSAPRLRDASKPLSDAVALLAVSVETRQRVAKLLKLTTKPK